MVWKPGKIIFSLLCEGGEALKESWSLPVKTAKGNMQVIHIEGQVLQKRVWDSEGITES